VVVGCHVQKECLISQVPGWVSPASSRQAAAALTLKLPKWLESSSCHVVQEGLISQGVSPAASGQTAAALTDTQAANVVVGYLEVSSTAGRAHQPGVEPGAAGSVCGRFKDNACGLLALVCMNECATTIECWCRAACPALQTRDGIMWWYPLCRWGSEFCSTHKWGWLCGLTMQYCQVRAARSC
jgi:hypothetical protein